MNEALWPLAVYFAAAIVIAGGMIGGSYVLGQRHNEPETGEPYESGVLPTGSAHVHLSVKFYMVAMFFVIFDLESIYIFAWAVSAREVGWAGYIEMLIFLAVLVAALAYLWRVGALDWSTKGLASPAEERKETRNEVVDEQARRPAEGERRRFGRPGRPAGSGIR
jgi:NADH-quinone oxidoreductase subunit A